MAMTIVRTKRLAPCGRGEARAAAADRGTRMTQSTEQDLPFPCATLARRGWRRWYPYATLIHRQKGSETMDAISERLEKAMEGRDPVIIIRSYHLGELVSSWLAFGRMVEGLACGAALASLAVGPFRQDLVPRGLAAAGLALQVFHAAVWGCERLSRYALLPAVQPSPAERGGDDLRDLGQVVLVRKPDRCLLRTALTVCAVGVCAYFYYKNR